MDQAGTVDISVRGMDGDELPATATSAIDALVLAVSPRSAHAAIQAGSRQTLRAAVAATRLNDLIAAVKLNAKAARPDRRMAFVSIAAATGMLLSTKPAAVVPVTSCSAAVSVRNGGGAVQLCGGRRVPAAARTSTARCNVYVPPGS